MRDPATKPLSAGYAIGQRLLTQATAWPLRRDLKAAGSDRARAQVLEGFTEGARRAIQAARQQWREQGGVSLGISDYFPSLAASVFTAAGQCGGEEADRHVLVLVDVLLSAGDPFRTAPEPPETGLLDLRRETLAALDRALLTVYFDPLVARHIGFGTRDLPNPGPEGDRAHRLQARWTHLEQVDVALQRSDFGRLLPASPALHRATTLLAFTRVLDTWPADPADPGGSPLAPLTQARFALPLLVKALVDEARRPVRRAAAGPHPLSPEDMLRALRDHSRTAPTFWSDVLATVDPDERTLLAFEVLAAESPGPEAEAVLAQLADDRVDYWFVSEAIAARAALRLRARREPSQEMSMP